MSGEVTWLAKSPWRETYRREHALAQGLAAAGRETTFVEHPTHLRGAVRERSVGRWCLDAVAPARTARTIAPNLRVLHRSVLAPGHVHGAAEALNTAMSQRLVSAISPADAVVAQMPWDWRRMRRLEAARRVFDVADDWSATFPSQRDRLLRHFDRIAVEADVVVVATPSMTRHFAGAHVAVVPNATDEELVHAPRAVARRERSMAYVGSLSARTDLVLLSEVLARLEDWTLDLYGPCLYRGQDGSASAAFERFLARHGERVVWHGPVSRERLAGVLDAASVGISPNVPALAAGQDAMKVYDYAARGLPVVATSREAGTPVPPHLRVETAPRAFADAVAEADLLAKADRAAQQAWAADHTWRKRLAEWRAATGV